MTTKQLSLGAALLCCVSLPPSAGAQQAEKDLAAMQGTWKVVHAASERPDSAKRLLGAILTIQGRKARLELRPQGDDNSDFTITNLQPEKTPKGVDLLWVDDDPAMTVVPLLAIYDVQKDRLRLAFSRIQGEARPTGFAVARGGPRQRSLVLQRVKKE